MALISTYYDGPVTESDRAKNLAGAPEYGVYGSEDFRVMAHPSIPYAVLVKKGRAHGHGVTDEALTDEVVNCTPLSGPSSNVRWDLIVVRRNWQPELGGPSTLEAIEAGTEAQIPAGRLVGPGVEDDQPIALVKWQGGVSAPMEFRDLRIWAANGGLHAVDPLVRRYMEKIGTEINISGEVWAYQRLSGNDIDWVKVSEVGKIPVFGIGGALAGTPDSGAQFLVQAGTQVNVSDDSGYARLTFPKPFPNGLLSITLTNGDQSIDRAVNKGTITMSVTGLPWNTGTKVDVVYTVAVPNAQLPQQRHRVNWIAIGW